MIWQLCNRQSMHLEFQIVGTKTMPAILSNSFCFTSSIGGYLSNLTAIHFQANESLNQHPNVFDDSIFIALIFAHNFHSHIFDRNYNEFFAKYPELPDGQTMGYTFYILKELGLYRAIANTFLLKFERGEFQWVPIERHWVHDRINQFYKWPSLSGKW